MTSSPPSTTVTLPRVGRLSPAPGIVVRDDPERAVTTRFLRDLGMPLAAITTFVEMVDDDASPQALREVLDAVVDNARYARELLRDFAHYQSLASGEAAVVRQRVALGKWLPAVLDAARRQLDARGLQLLVTHASLLPSDVDLDGRLAAAALEAVLRVAGERADRGPVNLRIAYLPSADGGERLSLRVVTRGGSFGEIDLGYAFVPFVTRGQDERPQLGLCLARRWCELLGGSLSVENGAHGECIYEVSFAASPCSGSSWFDPLEPTRHDLGPIRDGRLAFAEELSDSRLLAEPLLRRSGYSLCGVRSLDDCLRLLHDARGVPAGFVLPAQLGELTAADALAALRAEGFAGEVVVLGGAPLADDGCLVLPRTADGEQLLAALRRRRSA